MKCEINDSEVLAAVKAWGGKSMTYVVRNRLAANGRAHLKTSQVRKHLERMEREGKVVRVGSNYARQICWSAAQENDDA